MSYKMPGIAPGIFVSAFGIRLWRGACPLATSRRKQNPVKEFIEQAQAVETSNAVMPPRSAPYTPEFIITGDADMSDPLTLNQRFVLASRPVGAPTPENFRLEREALPT
jgi:hypothetical protein